MITNLLVQVRWMHFFVHHNYTTFRQEFARSNFSNCLYSFVRNEKRKCLYKEKNIAAAALSEASAENPRSKVENPPSRLVQAKLCLAATGKLETIQANREAFAAIGHAENEYVPEICQMAHVRPDYIFGQKRLLEAERRYSHGLLLTVVRCKDELPAKYLPRVYQDSQTDNSESEPESDEGEMPEDDTGQENASRSIPQIEPDPSIYEPLSENGMTAVRAWEAARCQLQRDMPKSTYDCFVRDVVRLSARDGTFVIAVGDDYAREWLEIRMTSSLTRLLAPFRSQRDAEGQPSQEKERPQPMTQFIAAGRRNVRQRGQKSRVKEDNA